MLSLSAASASVIAIGQKESDRRLYWYPIGDSNSFSLPCQCQENSIFNSDMKFSTGKISVFFPNPNGIKKYCILKETGRKRKKCGEPRKENRQEKYPTLSPLVLLKLLSAIHPPAS